MHLARLNSPKSWNISRKAIHWIMRPSPGPHSLKDSIPLGVIIRDNLKFANTLREVRRILNQGEVLVNDKRVKNPNFPLGALDILQFSKTGDIFLILINENKKFELKPLKKELAQKRLVRIKGKTILKKQKVQFNFHDGTNKILEKADYKPGDSLLLNKGKVEKHFKFEKGAKAYLFSGKHVGNQGEIIEISNRGTRKNIVKIKTSKEKIQTLKEYVFVIGDYSI